MCTNINIKVGNQVIVARSMDFASSTGANTAEFNKGIVFDKKSKTPLTSKYKFKAKYSIIDLKLSKINTISDGFNEAGLSIGTLWLPETNFGTALNPDIAKGQLSGLTLPQRLLGCFATVKEVKEYLTDKTVVIPSDYVERFATVHLAVVDKTGASMVVEFGTAGAGAGKPNFYDNPVGVLTNAPEFPWHLTNLRNMVQIDNENTRTNKILGKEFKNTGFGSNQLGMPGDGSPPSRFLRACVLLSNAMENDPPKTSDDAYKLLDKVMHQIAVIKGVSSNVERTAGIKTKTDYDYTQWIVLKNLSDYSLLMKTDQDLGFKNVILDNIDDDSDNNLTTFLESYSGQDLSESSII